MKRRGRSAYAIVKEEFGFKGNKKKVLSQLEELIEELISANQTTHSEKTVASK